MRKVWGISVKKLLFIPLMLSGIVSANADKSCSDEDLYEGAYLGLGESFQRTNVDVRASDNHGTLRILNNYEDADNWLLGKGRHNKLGGSLALGYGKFVYKRLYLGAEFTLDMTSSTMSYFEDNSDYSGAHIKTCGVIPTVVVRLGTSISYIKSLIYLRAGVTMLHSNFESEIFPNHECVNNKIRPVIGLGIERNICRNFNLRLEGDYRFPAKEKKASVDLWDPIDNVYLGTSRNGYQSSIQNKNSGYVVRVACIYYFK